MGDVGNVFRMQRFLGEGLGGRSFEMMGKLDDVMTGKTSPLARTMGLMAGLRGEKSFVQATLEMEKGLFGKGAMTEDSVRALKDRVTDTANLFGGLGSENAIMGVQSMLGPGATMTEAKSLIDLVSKDAGVAEFESARKEAGGVEQAAYLAMKDMNWKTIDKLLSDIKSVLGAIFDALGGAKALIEVLQQTRTAVESINGFIVGTQTKGLAETVTGVKGAPGEGLLTSGIRSLKGQVSVFEAGSPEFAEGLKTVSEDERLRMQRAAQKARERAMEMDEGIVAPKRDIGLSERTVMTKDKKFHFVIDLVDQKTGELIREIEQKHVEASGPPQGGAILPAY
jgi:hypothetical protein